MLIVSPHPPVTGILPTMIVKTQRKPVIANSQSQGHQPVLLAEATTALLPRPGGRYLDATFGGGGHSRVLLDAAAPTGIVLALDADPRAVDRAEALAAEVGYRDRLLPVHANFEKIASVAAVHDALPLDGILFDLGLSSFQLDTAERGFAFRLDGPLDMRFDPTRGEPASQLINRLSAEELADIFFRFGDEPRARRIAAAIVRERDRSPIDSTTRLAEVIQQAVGGRRGSPTHPATRSFQALRIAVNDELGSLERALASAVDSLSIGGRLAVISFHSLEDRIVKRFIAARAATCVCPPELPVCSCNTVPTLAKIGGSIRASDHERTINPRSRSAILRVAERVGPNQVSGARS